MPTLNKSLALIAMALLVVNAVPLARAQDASPSRQPPYGVHVTSELVLVNVVVRDRKGNLVRGLKKEDFTVTEDGKRQNVSTFDFENVDEFATAGPGESTVTGATAPGGLLRPANKVALDGRDRRL